MHLLVLSAFRPRTVTVPCNRYGGLNAPFGAQCFPTQSTARCLPPLPASQCTFWCSVLSDLLCPHRKKRQTSVSMHLLVLSAFRLDREDKANGRYSVSMHLLVLSAFRPSSVKFTTFLYCGSQCTFWCSVLSDANDIPRAICAGESQCTFWCSVLSDSTRG